MRNNAGAGAWVGTIGVWAEPAVQPSAWAIGVCGALGTVSPISARAHRSFWRGRHRCGAAGIGSPGLPRKPTVLCTGTLTPGATTIFNQRAFFKLSTSITDLSVSTVKQHVTLGDFVAFLLEPFDNGAFFGHLTELRHDDWRGHGRS